MRLAHSSRNGARLCRRCATNSRNNFLLVAVRESSSCSSSCFSTRFIDHRATGVALECTTDETRHVSREFAQAGAHNLTVRSANTRLVSIREWRRFVFPVHLSVSIGRMAIPRSLVVHVRKRTTVRILQAPMSDQSGDDGIRKNAVARSVWGSQSQGKRGFYPPIEPRVFSLCWTHGGHTAGCLGEG